MRDTVLREWELEVSETNRRLLDELRASVLQWRTRVRGPRPPADPDGSFYFPARFDPANLTALRANGDWFAPFHFDFYYLGPPPEDRRRILDAHGLLSPGRRQKNTKQGFVGKTNIWMHPGTEYWQRLHSLRSARLVRDCGAQALYYDISACNRPPYSDRTDLGYPPGAGRHLVECYRRLFDRSRNASREAASGRYVPQGTEVMVENLLDVLDFGQWRVSGGVQGDMEGERFLPWVKARRAWRVPLFTYVYHEYGGLRIDGWLKLAPEFGELFFHTAANVCLEGGIPELNYEFSPLERFPGMDGPTPQVHYDRSITLHPDACRVDSAKVEFLRGITAARTGFAKKYLAYGRMTPPAKLLTPVPSVDMPWSHYNDIGGRKEKGTFSVPAVVHHAWAYRDESVGLLFVNIREQGDLAVQGEISMSRCGLRGRQWAARRIDRDGSHSVPLRSTGEGAHQFSLTLHPRRIVLLEIAGG